MFFFSFNKKNSGAHIHFVTGGRQAGQATAVMMMMMVVARWYELLLSNVKSLFALKGRPWSQRFDFCVHTRKLQKDLPENWQFFVEKRC